MAAISYIGLGSNMGDRRAMLCSALSEIAALQSTDVAAVSSIYESAPWGLGDQPSFLNCVAEVRTEIKPADLMQALLSLEAKLGRVRNIHWGPRLVDLDMLTYDALEINTELLTLPHPYMTVRRFVLVPLMELNTTIIIKGKNVADYFSELKNDPNQDVMLWGAPPKCIGSVFQ